MNPSITRDIRNKSLLNIDYNTACKFMETGYSYDDVLELGILFRSIDKYADKYADEWFDPYNDEL